MDYPSALGTKPRRKQPSLRVKLASALLTIVRPDEHGKLVPVIGHQEAKTLTPEQVISRFHFDHTVHDTWGGSLHPSNLTPRPVAEHREKTKRDVKAIAKVRRGLKRRQAERPDSRALRLQPQGGDSIILNHTDAARRCEPLARKPKRLMQYTAMKATHKRTMSGKAERRTP